MKHQQYKKLEEISEIVSNIRRQLPEVDMDEVVKLTYDFSDLDLSSVKSADAKKFQAIMNNLSNEITEIMNILDQYCSELRKKVENINEHNTASKAYLKAAEMQ